MSIYLLLGIATAALVISSLAPSDSNDWDRAHAVVAQAMRERAQDMYDSGRIAKRWPEESDAEYGQRLQMFENLSNYLGVNKPSHGR